MQQDFKGIRQRGEAFQYNVSYKGQRVSGTAPTLALAVEERENALNTLRTGIHGDKCDKNVPNVPDVTKPTVSKSNAKTLKAVFDIVFRSRWEGTKGEKTALINGRAALAYFGEREHIDRITAVRIEEYAAYLASQENKGSTINRKLSALSTILKLAEDYELIDRAPRIHRKKEYGGRDRFVTEEEEAQMLALLEQWGLVDFREAVIVLLDTGLRCGELLRLRRRDVDFKEGQTGMLNLSGTKTDKSRRVPITTRVRATLLARMGRRTEERVFPYERSWIRKNWDRMRTQLGFENDEQFVPHILRHTCASRLVQNNVALPLVQMWLGHATLQTTMRYAHFAPTSLQSAVDALEKMR